MRKWIIFGCTAVLVFGLSATSSLLWNHYFRPAVEAPVQPHAKGDMDSEAPSKSLGANDSGKEAPSPAHISVRPNYNPDADDVAALAQNLRDRLADVRERENKLAARTKQLDLIFQDIRGERVTIDELRKQVSNELKAAEDQMTAVERKHDDVGREGEVVDKKAKDLEKTLTTVQSLESKNVKKIAEMYDAMAPESAAKILQQLTLSGKEDTAVAVLGSMKERRAAGILAQMSESSPTVAAQLLEKLKRLKTAPPPGKPQP